MDRIMQISTRYPEQLYSVARALSSMDRIRILKTLEDDSYNVIELASLLNIPASTAGLHVRILEDAGLIRTQIQPGTHGSSKLCSRTIERITVLLQDLPVREGNMQTLSMPVGAYTDCSVLPTCGLGGEDAFIGASDDPASFYLPERIHAQIVWSAGGYLEYRFPNLSTGGSGVKRLVLSAELCSEAPNYREDWKSDITLWINGIECGTWNCPGDFGERGGLLTPGYVLCGSTQYGLLTTWSVDAKGCYVNGKPAGAAGIRDLGLGDSSYITVRIGNKPDAKYKGGFNIFGAKAGDYPQDIQLTFEYE